MRLFGSLFTPLTGGNTPENPRHFELSFWSWIQIHIIQGSSKGEPSGIPKRCSWFLREPTFVTKEHYYDYH